jgi:tetratricopeptide (TPR) repeat protein
MLHKYFALGKVEFHRGRFDQARDALLFAEKCRRNREPVDFVYELLARVYLAMDEPKRAMETIGKVPEKFRRPYYRWTEADVLCARREFEKAKNVLVKSQEKDNRSRHKALLRLCKIEYLLGNHEIAFKHARDAGLFFKEKWGGILAEALFWQSVCLLMQGDIVGAGKTARELKAVYPRHPKLPQLFQRLTGGSAGNPLGI